MFSSFERQAYIPSNAVGRNEMICMAMGRQTSQAWHNTHTQPDCSCLYRHFARSGWSWQGTGWQVHDGQGGRPGLHQQCIEITLAKGGWQGKGRCVVGKGQKSSKAGKSLNLHCSGEKLGMTAVLWFVHPTCPLRWQKETVGQRDERSLGHTHTTAGNCRGLHGR